MEAKELKKFIKMKITKSDAPGLLRLAFHDSGTFCKYSGDGGVSGSITNELEVGRDENNGLQKSTNIICELKNDISDISKADIIAFAGAVAVEICGGPVIELKLGRIENLDPAPEGRLPDENDDADQLVEIFKRMGLSPKDLVVLSGAHTLGDADDKPFTEAPFLFDNSYFKILLGEDRGENLGRFRSDEALLEIPQLKKLVKLYAHDEKEFFSDFIVSYQKMVSLGF